MMICLIQYIEKFLVDDQLYFHSHTQNKKKRFSFHWRKSEGKDIWQVKELESDSHLTLKSPDLMTFMHAQNIDVAHVEQCMREAIVNQVVFARHFTREAERLFGSEMLQGYVENTEHFYNELFAAISHHLDAAPSLKPTTLPKARRPEFLTVVK